MSDKQQFCGGCRNDVYNQKGNSPTGTCWSLPTAKIVTRWRQGWWMNGDAPGAFREVRTLNCHHAPGRYAHLERLPDFAVNPVRLPEGQS